MVRATKYPPDGDRLWGPFYAPMRWGQSMAEYIKGANDNMLAIATIEHPDAVRNIDEIMGTAGLDLAFIGPGDLAMSLGLPGQFDHPKFLQAVAEAEAGILRSQVALGGVARTPEQARQMLDEVTTLLCSALTGCFCSSLLSGSWTRCDIDLQAKRRATRLS